MNTNFKLFSFILATVILMACVNQTNSVNEQLLNPVLTIEEIVNSQWKFFNIDGYLGDIKFEKDSRVTLYDHFNEKFWQFDRGVFPFLQRKSCAYFSPTPSFQGLFWQVAFARLHFTSHNSVLIVLRFSFLKSRIFFRIIYKCYFLL